MEDARVPSEPERRLAALHAVIRERELGEASFRLAVLREALVALRLEFGVLTTVSHGFARPLVSLGGGNDVLSRPTPIDDLLAGVVLTHAEPIVCGNLVADPALRDHLQVTKNGVSAYVGVPVPNSGEPCVLGLGARTPRAPFARQDVVYVETLAGLLASSLRAERVWRRFHALTYYDAVTGLPVKAKLQEDVEKLVADGERFAVFAIDVDASRLIEQYGHSVADRLIVAAGARLALLASEARILYRGAPSDFVLLARGCVTDADAEPLLEAFARAFVPPLIDEEVEVRLTVNASVAFAPDDGSSADELVERAIALRNERGRGGPIEVVSTRLDMRALRARMIADLHGAAERDELFLEYQPYADAACTRFEGVEALVRWRHPELGVLAPMQWLPLAEESGAIVGIGAWVLERAARTARRLRDSGFYGRVAVNVSIGQLYDRAFVERLAHALGSAQIAGDAIELEITESAALEDVMAARSVLLRCKDLGASVALDDFGTGYSSLAHLRDLPADVVKIDRSFVGAYPYDRRAATIASAVIPLARGLGRIVQAEGVETLEQLQWLQREGCDRIQGFLLARPCSEEQLVATIGAGILPQLADAV
ncbi:MAG TPA: sensor domain-containing phosphodiesterase [Candidatus Acidoferrum sp.]|nr:sensor domain-containing phosphodiesterase [Candidatus Acidoferrum sp.]